MKLKEAKKTLNNFLESLTEDTPIRNVIPDWATVQKEEITALKIVLQELENSISKDTLREIVDECIPKGKNLITGKEEYKFNTNANMHLTQKILELLEDK